MKLFKFTQAEKDFRAVTDPGFEGWHIITMVDVLAEIPDGVKTSHFEFNKVKIDAGREDTYHYHKLTYDLFIVEKGKFVFFVNDKDIPMEAGDAILMEPGDSHKPCNRSSEPGIFLEVRFNVTKNDRYYPKA